MDMKHDEQMLDSAIDQALGLDGPDAGTGDRAMSPT